MTGLTAEQALQKIDELTIQLKDMVKSHWELVGMTENDRDAYFIYLARIFRIHRSSANRNAMVQTRRRWALEDLEDVAKEATAANNIAK